MKTIIARIARGGKTLSYLLAATVALTTGGVWAGSTTYYQVAGTNDCTSVISLDGLPSDAEITYAPQLAFPGIKLDHIPERASFFTTSYGLYITSQDAICVGMHETRHYDDDGKCDKLALQCAVYDGVDKNHMYTKCVIIVLTNGAGGDGVYVQRVAQCYTSNWYAQTKFYTMDNSTGEISSANGPSGWSTTATSYQLAGLRIHGLSVAASGKAKGLAFPGVTLSDIKDCAFVAGYRSGRAMEVPAANNVATHVEAWPDSTNPQKLVMQFTHPTASYKTAVIQLTNGVDGVYAFQSHHAYNVNAKRFSIDSETGVVSATGGNASGKDQNQWQTSDDPPNYPVHDLFLLPPCVKKTATKVWSSGDPSHPLTLDDIKDGVFGSRFFGAWVTDMNYYRYTPNSAVGTIESQKKDDGGSVTNMVVWFEIPEGRKRVKVMFENGSDGIYATGIAAKYTEKNTDKDGTLAETHEGNGYALCDLRVMMPTVWTLDQDRTWSELRNGATLESDAIVRIKVTDPDAVLTIDENVNVEWIEFANGSGATMTVASDNTLTIENINGIGHILNNGTLVKTGGRTVVWPFNNASKGVYVVSNGTLKVASRAGNNTATPDQIVRVKGGAIFDMNGVIDLSVSVVLEEGAFFVNGGAYMEGGYSQAVNLTLEGDATARATHGFGLVAPGHKPTRLDLGSNTLTLDGSSDFLLVNTTITGNGTIAVKNGTLYIHTKASSGTNCTVSVGSGGNLKLGADFTVKNFVNGGASEIQGNGTLVVTGELTPSSRAIPKLTLSNGATVKMIGTNNAQTVSTMFTATGTVTIDASGITRAQLNAAENQRIPVLTVPTVGAGGSWTVANPPLAGCFAKWVNNGDGKSTLYLCKPLETIITIR